MYYVNCGDTQPHASHDYQIDGDYYVCAGIPSRTDD